MCCERNLWDRVCRKHTYTYIHNHNHNHKLTHTDVHCVHILVEHLLIWFWVCCTAAVETRQKRNIRKRARGPHALIRLMVPRSIVCMTDYCCWIKMLSLWSCHLAANSDWTSALTISDCCHPKKALVVAMSTSMGKSACRCACFEPLKRSIFQLSKPFLSWFKMIQSHWFTAQWTQHCIKTCPGRLSRHIKACYMTIWIHAETERKSMQRLCDENLKMLLCKNPFSQLTDEWDPWHNACETATSYWKPFIIENSWSPSIEATLVMNTGIYTVYKLSTELPLSVSKFKYLRHKVWSIEIAQFPF